MSAPRKVKAVVTHLKEYKDGVTFYQLKPEFRCRFKPGQFIHLALDNYDPSYNWPESRAFSIANAPGSEDIHILVSPKGEFTNRMTNEISVGREVWIKLPYGVFNFRESSGKDVVLIAGGTGISPFISFLEDSLTNNLNYKSISLFYGVREPELLIFEERIREFEIQIKEFSYRLFCERINGNISMTLEQGILPVKEIVNQTCRISGSCVLFIRT